MIQYILVVNLLEDVLEATVITFQDGVFGAQVQRPLLLQGKLETAVSKTCDGLKEGTERKIQ